MNVYSSVEDLVGNTPLVHASRFEKDANIGAHLFIKAECFNPTGSVKDRAVKKRLERGIEEGTWKPGDTIVEATSGNTGIALSSMGTIKGRHIIIVRPETRSIERRKRRKLYGAEIVLTPGAAGRPGAIEKAKELVASHKDYHRLGQFDNKFNPAAHYEKTAEEIDNDLDGKVDAVVAGIGTGGTITGIGEYFKKKGTQTKIIGVEPAGSPFLTKGVKGPHKIQGIGAGFKPAVYEADVVDEVKTVTDEDAFKEAKRFARLEGLGVGISSGAALHAALELAKDPKFKGKNIVVILPDGSDRYRSTPLFD